MSTTVLINIFLSKSFLNMIENAQNEIKLFGQKLRDLRKAKKLTIEQLANIAELERIAVSRIELGKTNPKLSTIISLAKALGISTRELFD